MVFSLASFILLFPFELYQYAIIPFIILCIFILMFRMWFYHRCRKYINLNKNIIDIKTIDTLLTDLFEFIKSNTLPHLWVTSKILTLPVQRKSLFGVTCALSQKTLKSSDEYPIMGLPWLLTMRLTTAVIRNGHKSRHKFKTWEV